MRVLSHGPIYFHTCIKALKTAGPISIKYGEANLAKANAQLSLQRELGAEVAVEQLLVGRVDELAVDCMIRRRLEMDSG
jgi:hypothetical protein